MEQNNTSDFLVVGAGLAGLSFAGDALQAGRSVRLLDKGRGVGGRAATRRLDGERRVDHGAPYFTAKSARLQGLAEAGLADGWLAVWNRGFPSWENGQIKARPPGHARYAPLSGMNTLAKRLARGLDVRVGTTVTRLEQRGDDWSATTADGMSFSAPALILNLPPVQLLALARPFLPSPTLALLENVSYDPTWTLIVPLARDLPGANWPALELKHPVFAFISRDHTKRPAGAPPTLVVHASSAWSKTNFEADPAFVRDALLAELVSVVGPIQPAGEASAHRWRYAQPTQFYPTQFLWLPDVRLGACGDWCQAARVEGALESGWALAAAVAAASAAPAQDPQARYNP